VKKKKKKKNYLKVITILQQNNKKYKKLNKDKKLSNKHFAIKNRRFKRNINTVLNPVNQNKIMDFPFFSGDSCVTSIITQEINSFKETGSNCDLFDNENDNYKEIEIEFENDWNDYEMQVLFISVYFFFLALLFLLKVCNEKTLFHKINTFMKF
jgi:hypothetical protein